MVKFPWLKSLIRLIEQRCFFRVNKYHPDQLATISEPQLDELQSAYSDEATDSATII